MQLESNSLLYIVFFFHFPLCTPELHMREIWQIEMRTLTKDQQPSAGGCEGHLFVTSDPTSCSCLHPSAPPRSQPSPRSWHCITNFMLHFRFASFPLSIVKGRVDPPESAFQSTFFQPSVKSPPTTAELTCSFLSYIAESTCQWYNLNIQQAD